MSSDDGAGTGTPHRVSIVVPVYQGEHTLGELLEQILPWTEVTLTPGGRPMVVEEVLLVHDNGPDDSARVIRELSAKYPFVAGVWLSRNFGQHPATLAGMASSGGEWIVTLDEDGQHDPAAIGGLLDTALDEGATVVYAKPTNAAPHGALRNVASRGSKWFLARVLSVSDSPDYQSFRLVLGEVGDFYERYWWWDVVLHGGSAVAFGLVGSLLMLMLAVGMLSASGWFIGYCSRTPLPWKKPWACRSFLLPE